MAAGDQALLVASDDRRPLMQREHPIGGRDADDPPLIEKDSLDRPGAADVRGDRDGHMCTRPGDCRPPSCATASARRSEAGSGGTGGPRGMRGEVRRVDIHHEDGCGSAERGHLVVTGGDGEDHGEGVVPLLRRSAVIEHAPRIRVERISTLRIRIRIVGRRATVARGEMHPGHGRPLAFGLRIASRISWNCAATSGVRYPRIACTPSFNRPIVTPRRRRAPSSFGSSPSGSNIDARSSARAVRSCAVGAGPATPSPPSESGSPSATEAPTSRPWPRAHPANATSAANRCSTVSRSHTFSIGPVAARNPVTPTTPSSSASRISDHRAGIRSPARLRGRRTRSTTLSTLLAARTSTRTVRCNNSRSPRHPAECGKSTASPVATVSTMTASARRNTAPAPCSTVTRSASDNAASPSSDSTASRSAMTRSRSCAVLFIPLSQHAGTDIHGPKSHPITPVQSHIPISRYSALTKAEDYREQHEGKARTVETMGSRTRVEEERKTSEYR